MARPPGVPDDVAELVAVDMGALGEGLQGNEHAVSICAKDSGGPYDLGIRRRLVALAQRTTSRTSSTSTRSTARMPRPRCGRAATTASACSGPASTRRTHSSARTGTRSKRRPGCCLRTCWTEQNRK